MAKLFLKQAKQYSFSRPSYPDQLFEFIASKTPFHDLVWDVGTGSGQAATALAKKYKNVVATDTSPKQLEFAAKLPNIRYQCTPPKLSMAELEQNIAAESTVDLVTIAQAMHWFDLPTFYQQVKWILKKPNGVIAAWCYTVPEVNPIIDAVFQRFYTIDSDPYWEPERKLVDGSAVLLLNMRLSPPWLPAIFKNRRSGLGVAAIAYVGVDYLRHSSPLWHGRLQSVLWTAFAIAVIIRVPFYKHWSSELRSALPFIFSLLFMLSALLFEAISVRFVTVVLGRDWHNAAQPLPDVGQWLLLALNEKLPQTVVAMLRARIIGLHHYLMLFVMLGFSVLFDSIEAPGLGLGARYMFTMGVGRILRALAFVSTILPSARPWCASARFHMPAYPHRWAQKYYVPYATDPNAIRHVIHYDVAYADPGHYNVEFRPDWGSMSFLLDFLRPTAPDGSSPWYHLLKKAGGGCNDLIYSGHMLVSVLTAMAWMEAYGGFSSILIWILVLHSAQREIRERHHYSVDCLLAIYMGIFLWKMIAVFWPTKDASKNRRLNKLDKIHGRLMQAAKDSDMDRVKELLKEVELSGQVRQNPKSRAMWLFSGATIFFTITMVLLAFTLTSDG